MGILPFAFNRCARVMLGIMPHTASQRLIGVQFHNPVELYRSCSTYGRVTLGRPTSCRERGVSSNCPSTHGRVALVSDRKSRFSIASKGRGMDAADRINLSIIRKRLDSGLPCPSPSEREDHPNRLSCQFILPFASATPAAHVRLRSRAHDFQFFPPPPFISGFHGLH